MIEPFGNSEELGPAVGSESSAVVRLLVGPVPVERDENGYWYHPEIPWDEIPDDTDARPFLKKWGYRSCFVSLEWDAPEELVNRYFEAGDPDCSEWNPTAPEGDGWFLAAIYDTEDGPSAMFLRAA